MITVDDFDRFIFIVGAPRCGTTTLSRFLKQHSRINFPAIKEPHFFAQHDLRDCGDAELKKQIEVEYLQRFFRADSERRVGADGSVTYLYKPEQLAPILRVWPDSRFVIALRNPLTMLPSLHKRLIYVGEETLAKFSDAWAAVPDRAAGRRIPRTCTDPRLLRYDEAGRFGTYLERLYAAVGKERCLVVIFDDLTADPAQEYRRLMEFVNLEPQAEIDLSPRRQGHSVRFPWLQRLLKRPPRAITEHLTAKLYEQAARGSDDAMNDKQVATIMSLRKRLLRWNRVARPVEAPTPALKNAISAYFRDEIELLGRLLDRDLSHWLQLSGQMAAPPAESDDERPIGQELNLT